MDSIRKEAREMGPSLTSHEEEEKSETDIICADCERAIDYGTETYLIQVVQPKMAGGSVFYYPVIDENDVNGDFLYEPFVYCFDCWDTHYWELKREAQDIPPVQDALSVIECACCGSGIREWEYAGTFTLGELDPSARSPNNVHGPRFVPTSKPDVLCLYCLAIFNDNYIVMWDELSQFGECADCILTRCWRHEQSCGCGCHAETEETEVTEETEAT